MSFWIAMGGLVLTLAGRWQKQPGWKQQHGYLWGAVLLLISAMLDQEPLLIVFEIVVVIGTSLAFVRWKKLLKSALTIGSGVLGLVVLFATDVPMDWHIIMGMIGLIIGATGFALINDRLQLTSSVLMTIYNAINIWLAVPAAIPFTILNGIYFILTSRVLLTRKVTKRKTYQA